MRPLDDLSKQNVRFLLGEEQFAPEFEENLLGKKAGEEATFSVSYPEDFLISEAAGKTVSFTVKVNEIHERVLPEADDDFAKDFEVEGISELREVIKEQLERLHEDEQLSSMRDQIVDDLLSKNQFDVPRSLLEKEEESLKARFLSDMQRGGVAEPEIGEDMAPKFTEKATEERQDINNSRPHRPEGGRESHPQAVKRAHRPPRRFIQHSPRSGTQGLRTAGDYGASGIPDQNPRGSGSSSGAGPG